MTFGSLRDLSRALNANFSNPTAPNSSLQEFEQNIESFVHRQHKIEETDSQKLHDDLLAIYHKHVAGNIDKHGQFVLVLRLLQPLIIGEKRLTEWWTLVIRPTVDAIGHKRDTIEDAKSFLLNVLAFDSEDSRSPDSSKIADSFTQKLLHAYLDRSKLPNCDNVISPEDEFIAHELESILVAFGRKRPKALLQALDDLLVVKNKRLQALSLLSTFVRLQPPHLHLVLETKVISHLQTCLLVDRSATVIDIALTVLIMFIPHITSTLCSNLPTLFLIYARIICWDQYNRKISHPSSSSRTHSPDSNDSDDFENTMTLEHDPDWEILESKDTCITESSSPPPRTNYLFTFLYGLFPLNFMAFIRKPRRYLKMKGILKSDDLDLHQNLIKSRSELHRVQHRLHANFFSTTIEDELIDNRWIKSDPAELVSECLGLSITLTLSLNDPGPPPSAKLPPLPRKLRNQSSKVTIPVGDEDTLGIPIDDIKTNSNRNTLSTTITAASSVTYVGDNNNTNHNNNNTRSSLRQISGSNNGLDQYSRKSSPQRMSMIENAEDGEDLVSPISQKTTTNLASPDSTDALSISTNPKLQVFAQVLSRFPLPGPNNQTVEHNAAVLQREVMLLKNELVFEKFQKQKYLEQIGHFQRKNMNDASVESDTQSILNTNRSLKARLSLFDEKYEQLKRETTARNNQAKKAEDQLTTKLKALKEEEKQLKLENETLNDGLQRAKEDCKELRNLVVESEEREFQLQGQLDALQQEVAEVDTLRTNLIAMSDRMAQYKEHELEYAHSKDTQQILNSELETSRLKLKSANSEKDRMKMKYEQRIMQLENDLEQQITQHSSSTPLTGSTISPSASPTLQHSVPATVQQMIDSALASSNAHVAKLKKQYTTLQSRYTDLHNRNQDLEVIAQKATSISNNSIRPASVLSLTQYVDENVSPNNNHANLPKTASRESSFSLPTRARSSISTTKPSIVSARAHDFAPPAPTNLSSPNTLVEHEEEEEEEEEEEVEFNGQNHKYGPTMMSPTPPLHNLQSGHPGNPGNSGHSGNQTNGAGLAMYAASYNSGFSTNGMGNSKRQSPNVSEIHIHNAYEKSHGHHNGSSGASSPTRYFHSDGRNFSANGKINSVANFYAGEGIIGSSKSFGRGGAGNHSKKPKDKEKEKEEGKKRKESGTGFRFKGIL